MCLCDDAASEYHTKRLMRSYYDWVDIKYQILGIGVAWTSQDVHSDLSLVPHGDIWLVPKRGLSL